MTKNITILKLKTWTDCPKDWGMIIFLQYTIKPMRTNISQVWTIDFFGCTDWLITLNSKYGF